MSVNFYSLACVKALELSFIAPLAKSFTFFLTFRCARVGAYQRTLIQPKLSIKSFSFCQKLIEEFFEIKLRGR
jgi:hypothetical protein